MDDCIYSLPFPSTLSVSLGVGGGGALTDPNTKGIMVFLLVTAAMDCTLNQKDLTFIPVPLTLCVWVSESESA